MPEPTQTNPNPEPTPAVPAETDQNVTPDPIPAEPGEPAPQGDTPPETTVPASTPSPETTPAPEVPEASIEVAMEQQRVNAGKELLDLVESNPQLHQHVMSAAAGAPIPPLATGVNGAPLQSATVPTTPAETPEPQPQDFMPEGQIYNAQDVLINPNSYSAVAKEKFMLARQDWVADKKVKAMEDKWTSESQRRENDQATNIAIQKIQTDFKMGQEDLNEYLNDLALLMKGKIPQQTIMERLHRGNEKVFEKLVQQHAVSLFEKWKADPGFNPSASVVDSPGGGDLPPAQQQQTTTPEDEVANAGQSFVI